jgi:hypothetical protein
MNKQVIITVLLALVTFVSCDSNKQRVTSPIFCLLSDPAAFVAACALLWQSVGISRQKSCHPRLSSFRPIPLVQ